MTRFERLAPLVVLALFVLLCAAIGPFHPDRSFITYRFAEHLAAGNGFVYNIGDAPVEGYASTAWVVACTALARAGLVLPESAWLLSFLLAVVALCLLWVSLHARMGVLPSFVACAFAALCGPLAIAAMSGEGASLTAATIMLVVYLLERASARPLVWMVAGAAGALLACCGNAFVLVFPVVLLVRVAGSPGSATHRSGWIAAAVTFTIGVVAFHAWRLSVFGSLSAPAPGFDAGVASPADWFVVQPYDVAPFGLFYLMLALLAGVGARFGGRSGWVPLGAAAVAGAIALASRDTLPGLAGSALLVPLLVIPAARLLPPVVENRPQQTPAMLLATGLLVASLGSAMVLRIDARHIRESYRESLVPLGKWMAMWRPDGSMLCDAPGTVPYYAGWHTDAVAGSTIPSPAPDVVILTSFGLFETHMRPAGSAIASALTGHYRVLAGMRRDWTRDRSLIIYARADIPEMTDSLVASFPQGLGTVARVNR